MIKGVVVQGLVWESCEIILWPPCSSSKGVYHMTSDKKWGGKVRRGSELYDQWYERSGGLNRLTSLGPVICWVGKRSPWGQGPNLWLSVATHSGLSTLVTFCIWLVFLSLLLTLYYTNITLFIIFTAPVATSNLHLVICSFIVPPHPSDPCEEGLTVFGPPLYPLNIVFIVLTLYLLSVECVSIVHPVFLVLQCWTQNLPPPESPPWSPQSTGGFSFSDCYSLDCLCIFLIHSSLPLYVFLPILFPLHWS